MELVEEQNVYYRNRAGGRSNSGEVMLEDGLADLARRLLVIESQPGAGRAVPWPPRHLAPLLLLRPVACAAIIEPHLVSFSASHHPAHQSVHARYTLQFHLDPSLDPTRALV